MSDEDAITLDHLKAPWLSLFKFLNHVVVDAVGAIAFILILSCVSFVLEHVVMPERLVFCPGTRFQFNAIEVMDYADAFVFVSFIAIGVFKGIREAVK